MRTSDAIPHPHPTRPRSPHRRAMFVLLWLAAGLAPAVHAADTAAPRPEQPGPIISATVTRHGAIVERELRVPGGRRHVAMNCVPETVDDQSLKVTGTPEAEILDVHGRELLEPEMAACRAATRDPRLNELEARRTALEASLQGNAVAMDYLKRWDGAGARAISGAASARTGSDDPAVGAAALERQARGLAEARARLEKELQEVKTSIESIGQGPAGKHHAALQWAMLEFDVATRAAATLRLRYRVEQVSATYLYRAELDGEGRTLTLERQAHLIQESGEPWDHVRVTLSTLDPSGKPQAPLPGPWTLATQPQAPATAPSARRFDVPAPAYMQDTAQRVEITGSAIRPDVDLVPRAAVAQRDFDTSFVLPEPVTIVPGSSGRMLTLETHRLPATVRVRVVPRQAAAGWLSVQAPRPPGIWPVAWMELWRDGLRVGSANWGAGDEDHITLPFGRDDRVRVEVTHPVPYTSTAGLFGSRTERRWADAWTVTNRHATPIDVELLDSLPQSTEEDVKIALTVTPEPVTREWENHPGIAMWSFPLAPGASQRVSIAGVVSHPSDRTLVGMP